MSLPPLSMTAADKRRFIRSLTKTVTKELLSKVPKLPREWDGIELRELIADSFDRQRSLSTRSYWGDASGRAADRKRLRAYSNEVMTRNLT